MKLKEFKFRDLPPSSGLSIFDGKEMIKEGFIGEVLHSLPEDYAEREIQDTNWYFNTFVIRLGKGIVMGDLNRNVWEGWTPQDFIDELAAGIEMIMNGQSFVKPFTNSDELISYIVDSQPYYKKAIPEVNDYFIKLYRL